MEASFSFCLPREEASVPIVRHLARAVLTELGVNRDCVDDLELALTEACTNVLKHAARLEEDYEVVISIDGERALFQVCDTGGGFDTKTVSPDPVAVESERGRGIHLMRAVVDQLGFESAPDKGTVVRFKKDLEFVDDSVVRRLTGA